jgi:hypothetical protein
MPEEVAKGQGPLLSRGAVSVASGPSAHGDDDTVTAEQVAADDELCWYVEQEDLYKLGEDDVRCLVLDPVD